MSGTDGPGARSGAGPSTRATASRPAVRRRRWLITIPLFVAIGGYIGAALYMRANETTFVFHPDQYGGRAMIAAAEDLPVEAVRIPTPDSLTLSAWVIPPVPATSYVVVTDRTGKVVYTGLGGEQDIEAAIQKALK